MAVAAHGILRAKGCLADTRLGRETGDAAKVEPAQPRGVRRAEECADVVQAADVVEQGHHRKLGNPFVSRGRLCGTIG